MEEIGIKVLKQFALYFICGNFFFIFLQVLDLMQEVSEDEEPGCGSINAPLASGKAAVSSGLGSSVSSGPEGGSSSLNPEDEVSCHSDSDSTIMMSGNSPFISKAARYNFLSRSSKRSC